jgi:hypothetical protein
MSPDYVLWAPSAAEMDAEGLRLRLKAAFSAYEIPTACEEGPSHSRLFQATAIVMPAPNLNAPRVKAYAAMPSREYRPRLRCLIVTR